MRKLFLVFAAVFATAAIAVPAASAGNAHFIKSATGATVQGADLKCFFKEAGLESGSVENITCSATEAITYECVNGGNHNPSASNKTTFVTTGSGSGNFPADKNGNVVGDVTIIHASAASLGFSCPSGQTVTLVSVVYSDVSITDNTSGATISIPGTFSYTNPDAP
jgi:hypothetical protein